MKKTNVSKKIKVEGGEAMQSFGRGVTELDKENLILAVWESKMNGLCNSGGPVANECFVLLVDIMQWVTDPTK
ncbi:hypothetical protein AXF42_Ash020457 [Apostasia shenzhenica]|uniref:Uncharacterized protein n=1 Tax=Apostasia shenzhenica TaxID=1088818 RepID=A0A2H9ZYH4_9ASPA|nr:hypothetical protein AXF42_Ash020457 [Apostasia shenzhenica]